MTYIAKEGTIFYKQNGKSNLDNIKETKAYDVLLWASEQDDQKEIINAYYNNLSKK